MTTPESVQRDERTLAVANASYKWACIFITFALLIDVMCRAWFLDEAAWDLIALVVVTGAIATMYQARHKVLGQVLGRKAVLAVLLPLLACVIAFVFATILTITRAM
jgi:hypothetical protein